MVSIAKEHGHEFTVEKIVELSEEELEGVDGGGGTNPRYNGACGATRGYGIFCRG
ncbi:nif11-like leader peptide domain protein [Synechococcus sp. NOUM97013]|nr:nif11-like leader peptide domain protein [Synechococcus sp. NOUM97013]